MVGKYLKVVAIMILQKRAVCIPSRNTAAHDTNIQIWADMSQVVFANACCEASIPLSTRDMHSEPSLQWSHSETRQVLPEIPQNQQAL